MFIRMPESPAADLVLTEEGGYQLTLRDRFLPYRPVTIGGRQRAEFTWYPGSPEATVQMLGPEEDSIQLRGFWKDKFLQWGIGVSPSAIFTPTVGNLSPSPSAASVADLVQGVDDMRRMGRRITLDWAGLKRVGHIVAFRQTWHNVHDVEWEIDFAVVSQGENTVPAVGAAAITIPDVYLAAVQQVASFQETLINSSGLPGFVAKTQALNSALNIVNLNIVGVANTMAAIAQGYAGAVISVSQAARRTISTMAGAVKNVQVSVFSVGDMAASELFSWGVNGAEDNTAIGQVLAALSVQRNFTNQFQAARYSYASQAAAAAQQSTGLDSQVQTFVAPNDLDYRDISTRYYGTPDNWLALMQYNGVSDSRVSAGTTVYIPPVTQLSGAASKRGGG